MPFINVIDHRTNVRSMIAPEIPPVKRQFVQVHHSMIVEWPALGIDRVNDLGMVRCFEIDGFRNNRLTI